MPDFSQFFSATPWGSWAGGGQAPQPPQHPAMSPAMLDAVRRMLGAQSMTHQAEQPNPMGPMVDTVGHVAKELPGALFNKYVADPVRAAKGLTEKAMRGESVSEDPKDIVDAYKAAGLIATGALPGGAFAVPKGSAGIFGGRLAQTADRAAADEAANMLKAGASKEDIWNKTGWFQGADDKWRFEIPDAAASDVSRSIDIPHERAAVGDVRVGDVFQHGPLFDAYPQTKDYPFGRDTEAFALGHFQPENKQVAVSSYTQPDAQRSTMLHELQHGVQHEEGFATGSNPFGIRGNMPENPAWQKWSTHPVVQEFNKLHNSGAYHGELNDANRLWREKYQPDMRELEKQWIPRGDQAGHDARQAKFDAMFAAYNKEIAGKFPITERVEALDRQLKAEGLSGKEPRRYLDAMDVYKAHAGEVEARNVQTRKDMTPEQRRAAPPWTTEDVPREQQIVRGAR